MVKIGPVSKDLLYIKIADAVLSYIEANSLKPGDKLPSEREMAEMFQTGRNSVREALRVLENRGVVEVKTGRGVFLKDQSTDSDVLYLKLVKDNYIELHEMRAALEDLVVEKSIQCASEEERKRLLDLAAKMMALYRKGLYDHVLDHAFHVTMAESARNNTVAQIIDKMRLDWMGEYWNLLDVDESVWLETIPQHLTIAEAIRDRDLPCALAAMREIHNHSLSVLLSADKKRSQNKEN